MAIHELYIGGDVNPNKPIGRFFPSAPINLANINSACAGHRSPVLFSITRDLTVDPKLGSGPATRDYLASLATTAPGPLVIADRIGLVVLPKKTVLLGVHFETVVPAPGFTAEIRLRRNNTLIAASPSFTTVNSAYYDQRVIWPSLSAYANAEPYLDDGDVLDLVILGIGAAGLGARAHFKISAVLLEPTMGGP